MRLQKNNLKSMNKLRKAGALLAIFCVGQLTIAQTDSLNVIERTGKDSIPKNPNFKKIKIDGVASVVGDYVILNSDIDKTFIDLQSQGQDIKNITRCQLLGKLMEDKLYAHHAVQDSILVSDGEVYGNVDRQIDYFLEQLGGDMNKLLRFYNKTDEESFRQELFQINKVNLLSKRMQDKIVEEVEITPEEVRQFFNNIPKDELPVFGTELEIGQIVVQPKIPETEKKKAIERLKQIKAEVEDQGTSFATKAILYSHDRATGGKTLSLNRKSAFVKEFKDVAFTLEEGEISEPFETEFGWHIVQLDRKRGQEIDVRHILLIPEVPAEALREAREKMETIRKRIVDGEISFEDAALEFSDEKETKFNKGQLINPSTLDTRFELTRMDPSLYSQIVNLADGELSQPLLDEDRTGTKKYKILRITNRHDEHVADYSRDYTKIQELAVARKTYESRSKMDGKKKFVIRT